MNDEGLRRALDAYRERPIDINDSPESWRRLDALLDACDAALAARSEPRADFGSQGGVTTGYGIASYPATPPAPERRE